MKSPYVWDIEAKGFLDSQHVDYLSSPYKLKEPKEFVHCVGFVNANNPEDRHTFVGYNEIKRIKEFVLDSANEVIGHNILGYDLPVMRAAFDWEFYVAGDSRDENDKDTLFGEKIILTDTLVMSKTLNPDRPKHSIEYFGGLLGLEKIDWRAKAVELGLIAYNAPKGAEFAVYHPEMAVYMMRDCDVNVKVWKHLLKEWGDWNWDNAYVLEKAVRELISRQEQRGFKFNAELAQANVRELDILMEEIRQEVDPLIPSKPLGKTKQKEFTPPKVQFLKSGQPSTHLKKFVEKHKGEISELGEGEWQVDIFDKTYSLPLPQESLITHEPATVDDTTHIKGWLRTLGWIPTAYKERDLTVDSKKKKLTQEQFEAAVERYVEQTLNSPFCEDRCAELDTSPKRIRQFLLGHNMKRPLKVYTNPSLTVGMEKEIDPALLALSDKFPHAKQVSEYLTYKHRRNSILGGGVDPDDWDDEEEADKGFLADDRIQVDGRISTPADTCGAGTSRFKHRKVANIPRVSSLYGDKMRAMFGADVENGCLQLGYDFDSLEAKQESHYVYRYPGGKEYGVSLTAEKPNDCHSVLAASITELLGRPFPRSTAKNVKYGCVPVDNTEVLTDKGWKRYEELTIGGNVLGYDINLGKLVWTDVKQLYFYKDADVGKIGNQRWNVEATEDHRWVVADKYGKGGIGFKRTFELQTNSVIINAANYEGGSSSVTPAQAGVIGWLLTDGYWKWSGAEPARQNSYGKANGVVACIGQSVKKFHKDVQESLEQADVRWAEYTYDGMTEFRLNPDDFRALLKDCGLPANIDKHSYDWASWVLNLNYHAIREFISASWLADGRTTNENAFEIRQNKGNISDAIAIAFTLLGMKTTVRGERGSNCGTIRGSHAACTGYQTGSYQPSRKTDVFCISTGTESFVIRQGGVLTITGNCSYNAQVARVAKTVGCSLEEAQIIFDTFWEHAYPLKALKEKMQDYWENKGQKKFLLGMDGRKLPVRSKGNVINTALQSGGVICAKRAMVIHDRAMRKEGMLIDFFKDDWKNAEFCQQMCAYHDEAQLEIKRSLVKFKKFASEEEAKAFSDPEKVWSDVIHNDKGYFRAYCRAGELASLAVKQAGEYYKLNVELTAGYIVGQNWKECH